MLSAAQLLDEALDVVAEVAHAVDVRHDSGYSVHDEYVAVVLRLTAKFGAPDFPEYGVQSTIDWRVELGVSAEMFTVWDFDYYQLSVRVEGEKILLERHRGT